MNVTHVSDFPYSLVGGGGGNLEYVSVGRAVLAVDGIAAVVVVEDADEDTGEEVVVVCEGMIVDGGVA